jgi:hypothetical protein
LNSSPPLLSGTPVYQLAKIIIGRVILDSLRIRWKTTGAKTSRCTDLRAETRGWLRRAVKNTGASTVCLCV